MIKDKALINTHWRGRVKDLWSFDKSFVVEYAIVGLTDDWENSYQYNIVTNKIWSKLSDDYHTQHINSEFMQGHDYMMVNCVPLPLSVGSLWQPNISVPDSDKKIYEILCHCGDKIVLLNYATTKLITTTPDFLRPFIALDQ